jgi:hypothetical protein
MVKPTKTKKELRDLILSEIAGHPVCPAGMDVLITGASDGGWQALSIPPEGPIAYQDCIQYIGRIAGRLRSEYDMSTDPRSFKFPPVPQFVDFSNVDERISWFEAQPAQFSIVISARAALRSIPMIKLGSSRGSTRKNIVLRAFRAVAAAWATGAFPGQIEQLRRAARDATSGLGDLSAALPIRAAVYSAATAASVGVESSKPASTAVSYALDAVGSRGREAFQDTWTAIATDAQLLDRNTNTASIAHSKLWPGRNPDWADDNWQELKSALHGANEGWEVWTEWYEDRLMATVPDEVVELGRVTIPEKVWGRGPKVANAKIKEIIEEREIFRSANRDELGDEPPVETIPQQEITGSQFRLDGEGLIDIVPDPPNHAPYADATQRELFEEMRHKGFALAEVGHNLLAELSTPVERFCSALPEDIETVSISRVWSRGNTLRRHLKAHGIAIASDEPFDPARLPPIVAENLHDLVETFNVFILGDPKGRDLDQVRLGPQERVAAQAIVNASLPIAEAVKMSERLATVAAVDTLIEQVEAARDAPTGVDGDQAIDLSRKTATNFIGEALRVAYAPIRKLISAGSTEAEYALKEIRAGAYRAAGPAGIGGAYFYRQEIISFIVDNATNLKSFVEQAFHSPELARIIDVIVQTAGKIGI